MLTSNHIFLTLRETTLMVNHDFNMDAVQSVVNYPRSYSESEFTEFKRDLVEAGNKIRLLYIENSMDKTAFLSFIKQSSTPVLTFSAADRKPILLKFHKQELLALWIDENESARQKIDLQKKPLLQTELGEIIFFAIFHYDSPLGEPQEGKPLSPVQRLMQLLGTERKEIFYILFYAIVVGLVSLILPLGIQTTVELVSGGVVFSSVYLMIALVIFGVLLSGALQIVQISLVEYLQRRIFTKAAFEFAFRIPRIRMEALTKSYAPELVNRFFDVMTIQKGLPKLLIDLSSSLIQILFGLLLISLYHPFFVFFSLLLVSILALIFYFTGPRGLQSSILESKYKYKVAQWLEELARSLHSFKLAGNTDLPIRKTDYYTNNYLKNRKTHFNTLVIQYGFVVVFKAAIVGGLLIMGTILVVDRQITLGQFVAAEVIIILVLNAVEKIIMYMDVVYDLLTAVDKVAHVTDLAIEKTGGLDFNSIGTEGFSVTLKNLRYKYIDEPGYQLKGVDLNVAHNEKICISGPSGSGKSTLTNIIAGLYTNYEGVVAIDNYSMRDLDLKHVRDFVSKNISSEDLFDGSILENITMGKTSVTTDRALQALEHVGLREQMHALPQGLDTPVLSGGKGFSETFIHKLIVARCLANQPKLLVLNDFFYAFCEEAKRDLLQRIISASTHCTIIFVSNDPVIQRASDRVVWLEDGKVKMTGARGN